MPESQKSKPAKTIAEPTVRQRIDARLKEIDKGIDALEARAKEIREDTAETVRESLASLRKKRKALVSRLGELGGSSSEALGDIKDGAGNAWDELRQSARDLSTGVGKALDRFRKGD